MAGHVCTSRRPPRPLLEEGSCEPTWCSLLLRSVAGVCSLWPLEGRPLSSSVPCVCLSPFLRCWTVCSLSPMCPALLAVSQCCPQQWCLSSSLSRPGPVLRRAEAHLGTWVTCLRRKQRPGGARLTQLWGLHLHWAALGRARPRRAAAPPRTASSLWLGVTFAAALGAGAACAGGHWLFSTDVRELDLGDTGVHSHGGHRHAEGGSSQSPPHGQLLRVVSHPTALSRESTLRLIHLPRATPAPLPCPDS